jgi:hypothetical protein
VCAGPARTYGVPLGRVAHHHHAHADGKRTAQGQARPRTARDGHLPSPETSTSHPAARPMRGQSLARLPICLVLEASVHPTQRAGGKEAAARPCRARLGLARADPLGRAEQRPAACAFYCVGWEWGPRGLRAAAGEDRDSGGRMMHARHARANERVGTGNGARMLMHARASSTDDPSHRIAWSHIQCTYQPLPFQCSIISAADDDDTVYEWIVASSSVYYSLR